MNENSGWRRPVTIGKASNYDATATCTRPMQACAHNREDGQTATVLNYLHVLSTIRYRKAHGTKMLLTCGGILSTFFSDLSPCPCFPFCSAVNPSMQKLLKIRAALSDSFSNEVGQNASAPSLFVALFTGTPTLSNHFLLLSLVFCQVDDLLDV
jgi:hypothetical protein